MTMHEDLPVSGYTKQSDERVDRVNANKEMEERVLRVIDELQASGTGDPRWPAIGRTQMEQAWMSINRAIFQPSRVHLADDP